MKRQIINKSQYHWNDKEKAARDFEYLQKLKHSLVSDIACELNRIHDIHFSHREWLLIVGGWLIQFISIVFDRWSTLSKDNEKDLVEDNKFNFNDLLKNIPQNTSQAGHQFHYEEKWDDMLVESIRLELKHSKLLAKYKRKALSNPPPIKVTTAKSSERNSKFRDLLKSIFNWFLQNTFIFSSKVFVIVGSSLSTVDVIKLLFYLKGRVYLFRTMPMPKQRALHYDINWRLWTIPTNDYDNEFERLIKSLLPIWMPVSFIEGFKGLRENSITLQGDTKIPNAIFTANEHLTNDFFKIWAAENMSKGSKLVIGQHGGGPFHRYSSGMQQEIDISDLYMTTGNGNQMYPHIRDVGQFFARLSYGKWNPKGSLLVITVLMPKKIIDLRSMPKGDQMLSYFDDQFRFYDSLTEPVKEQTFIRLYNTNSKVGNPKSDFGWDIVNRWRNRFPNVQLEEPSRNMSFSVQKCRLFISTYNATTYNESLAANIPTVIYWDKRYWEYADYAEKDFNELRSVGIFHDNPESAASHVNKIWNDVDEWWRNDKVQSVRRAFCRKYANLDKKIIKRFANVMIEASSQDKNKYKIN